MYSIFSRQDNSSQNTHLSGEASTDSSSCRSRNGGEFSHPRRVLGSNFLGSSFVLGFAFSAVFFVSPAVVFAFAVSIGVLLPGVAIPAGVSVAVSDNGVCDSPLDSWEGSVTSWSAGCLLFLEALGERL